MDISILIVSQIDVFKILKERIDRDQKISECFLLCDAMSIKSAVAVAYNISTRNYEGDSIKVPYGNSVATEATIFICLSVFVAIGSAP